MKIERLKGYCKYNGEDYTFDSLIDLESPSDLERQKLYLKRFIESEIKRKNPMILKPFFEMKWERGNPNE